MNLFINRNRNNNNKNNENYVRRAYHSGSWYSDSHDELNNSLSEYLENARSNLNGSAAAVTTTTTTGNTKEQEAQEDRGVAANHGGIPRGVIVPHAGFSYSGPTAAYSYTYLCDALVQKFKEVNINGGVDLEQRNDDDTNSPSMTIVVLHPSHHVYLDGCAISGASVIETPLVDVNVDSSLRDELLRCGVFTTMSRNVDEEEHSGEMQYPYIAKAIMDAQKIIEKESSTSSKPVAATHNNYYNNNQLSFKISSSTKILPIMVGSISTSEERRFGKILAPFLVRENVFTVVSSDFCHWGKRFHYDPKPPTNDDDDDNNNNKKNGNDKKMKIYEYIEWLDRLGMDNIAMQEPGAFATYMKTYKNTICGRHPIGVWLNALKTNSDGGLETLEIQFVNYAQSGRVMSDRESSVSYASAVGWKC